MSPLGELREQRRVGLVEGTVDALDLRTGSVERAGGCLALQGAAELAHARRGEHDDSAPEHVREMLDRLGIAFLHGAPHVRDQHRRVGSEELDQLGPVLDVGEVRAQAPDPIRFSAPALPFRSVFLPARPLVAPASCCPGS